MPKRNTDSRNRAIDSTDSPLGLSGAFAPIKGPQSVDYDADDEPIGLTGSFEAIPDEDDEHDWSSEEKWEGFAWDSDEDPEDAAINELAEDIEEFYDDGDAVIDEEESPHKIEAANRRSKRERERLEDEAAKPKTKGRRGRHAAFVPELSPRMQKSKRTRRVLMVLLALLVIIIGALGYFSWRTYADSQQEAVIQTQEQTKQPKESLSAASADDATESTTRLADVPNLENLIGKNQESAIKAIGHGALITSNREVNEEGSPIKVNLNIALTEEAADSKTGTPTVYLGLAEDGTVVQAGYSASASALGFGALSFADAVSNEHVVEKTLAKTGISVPMGSAVLPATKAEYTSYGTDGTTIVRERCSFDGTVDIKGVPFEWSSVLSYDYTTQVLTGNLNDTVRIIYVYITKL